MYIIYIIYLLQLTLADLAMANALGFVGDLDGKKYSKLKAFKSRVESNPAIAKWIAKRPVTVM
jgi:glutathione S-transferase